MQRGKALLTSSLALGVTAVFVASTAKAVVVPPGVYPASTITFSEAGAGQGTTSFDGVNFITAPNNDVITVNVGAFQQTYPGSTFAITNGFNETSSIVLDGNFNGLADTGETVITTLGTGAFTLSNASGIIVTASFSTGTFLSSVGATGGSTISADGQGLDLVPGPAFDFDNTSVLDILDPEALSFSLVSIPSPGVAVTVLPVQTFPGVLSVDLLPFGAAKGSVNASGTFLVPEPTMISLVSVVGLGMLARRRRN